jgi:hypothetical protein
MGRISDNKVIVEATGRGIHIQLMLKSVALILKVCLLLDRTCTPCSTIIIVSENYGQV